MEQTPLLKPFNPHPEWECKKKKCCKKFKKSGVNCKSCPKI